MLFEIMSSSLYPITAGVNLCVVIPVPVVINSAITPDPGNGSVSIERSSSSVLL
jgi:hypothetical protein